MTSAAASARHEWWPAFAHHAWKLLLVAYVSCVAQVFAAPLAIFWSMANVAAVFGLVTIQQRHDRRLCERCIADWPLDPEASVARCRRRLRAFHWVTDRFERKRSQVILVVILSAGLLAAAIWLPAFGYAMFTLVLYTVLAAFAVINRAHWRLEPWCPQCRRRGKGDDTFSPDPVTPPSVRADR